MHPAHPPTPARDGPVLPLPPAVPRVPYNALTRWIGRSVLRLGGWRMVGAFPDTSKLVLVAVPRGAFYQYPEIDLVTGLVVLLRLYPR